MLSLGRIPASTLKLTAHILPPSLASSPPSPNTTDSWKAKGFRFIPVRQRHLELLGFAYGREPPPLDQIHGNTMVDREFLPLGFCFVWFEPDGTKSVHAHFGKWLRIYPKDILRGMKMTFDELRAMGCKTLVAIADESIDGSLTLVKWFKGAPTGRRGEFGPIYTIDLERTPL